MYVIFGKSSFVLPLELSSLNAADGFIINGIDEEGQAGDSVAALGEL